MPARSVSSAAPLQLELVTNSAKLIALETEWSSTARNPFQSPEWMLTWWRHFGNGDLHTFVFREQDRLAAIIPAFLHRWNERRQITLIGSGITDYLDPPIEQCCEAEVLALLQAHLESDTTWDICEWQDLSGNTPLRRIGSGSLQVCAASDTECSVVSLPDTPEEFWKARSKDLRRNVVRYRKKAEGQGALELEIAREARPELVEGLIALHEARWHAHGEAGMIAANRSGPFLRDVAEAFERRGILRLFALRFRGELAAAILSWLDNGTLFFYMSGFEPGFEWFSPGQTLLAECLRYSYEQGCRTWDFLRGSEAYKFAWGAKPVPKCRVAITRS